MPDASSRSRQPAAPYKRQKIFPRPMWREHRRPRQPSRRRRQSRKRQRSRHHHRLSRAEFRRRALFQHPQFLSQRPRLKPATLPMWRRRRRPRTQLRLVQLGKHQLPAHFRSRVSLQHLRSLCPWQQVQRQTLLRPQLSRASLPMQVPPLLQIPTLQTPPARTRPTQLRSLVSPSVPLILHCALSSRLSTSRRGLPISMADAALV